MLGMVNVNEASQVSIAKEVEREPRGGWRTSAGRRRGGRRSTAGTGPKAFPYGSTRRDPVGGVAVRNFITA
jgi:hypothetical protein